LRLPIDSFRTIRRWRPGAYARDGLHIFGWLLLRVAAQAATVLLLARWLGASGYGEFVAALAVAGFFTPLAGLGLGAVLLVRGARARAAAGPASPGRAAVGHLLGGVQPHRHRGLGLEPTQSPAALGAGRLGSCRGGGDILGGADCARQAGPPSGACVRRHPGRVALGSAGGLGLIPTLAARQPRRVDAHLRRCQPHLRSGPWHLLCRLLAFSSGETAFQTHKCPLARGRAVRGGRNLTSHAGGIQQARARASGLYSNGCLGRGAASGGPCHFALGRVARGAVAQNLCLRTARLPSVANRAMLVALALLSGAALALAAPVLPWLLGPDFTAASQALICLALLPAVQLLRNLGNAWL
jgi:hypothetical protein